MSEFEKQKNNIAVQLKNLCAHCANEIDHNCRVKILAEQVTCLSGIPLIVNSRFSGLLFTK